MLSSSPVRKPPPNARSPIRRYPLSEEDKCIAYAYTPLNLLSEDAVVNVHCRVVACRPSKFARHSWQLLCFVTDLTTYQQDARQVAVLFFRPRPEDLPSKIGTLIDQRDCVVVLQLRRFKVQRFQEQWQLVSAPYSRWTIFWTPVTSTASSGVDNSVFDDPSINVHHEGIKKEMAAWSAEPPHRLSESELAVLEPYRHIKFDNVKTDGALSLGKTLWRRHATGRPTLLMRDVQPGVLFDLNCCIVRVVHVPSTVSANDNAKGQCLQIVITDYTRNPLLQDQSYERNSDAQMVISIWDNFVPTARRVCTAGALVHLGNLAAKATGPGGILAAALHGDPGCHAPERFVHPLRDEEKIRELEHRRQLLDLSSATLPIGSLSLTRIVEPWQSAAKRTTIPELHAASQCLDLHMKGGRRSVVGVFCLSALVADISPRLLDPSARQFVFLLRLQDANSSTPLSTSESAYLTVIVCGGDAELFLGCPHNSNLLQPSSLPGLLKLTRSLLPSDFCVVRYLAFAPSSSSSDSSHKDGGGRREPVVRYRLQGTQLLHS